MGTVREGTVVAESPYAEFGYEGPETAEEVLKWALKRFHPDIALACSFEHTILIEMMVRIRPDIRVFSLDTGRLPEETFQCAAEAERRFGIRVEWYFPDREKVERLVREGGVYSFRNSVEERKACCAIRKVEPLRRALKGLRAWVTGLRRGEADSRRNIQLIERDEAHGGLLKINPLLLWTDEAVRAHVREHRLPYNRLLDRGYASIGCTCCTRPVEPGEHPRAGRWWWERSGQKECGLHVPDWQI